MKKLLLTLLITTLMLAAAACSNTAPETAATPVPAEETPAATEVPVEAEGGPFVLEYPSDMQALGFTEPIVLEARPTRVASMSVSPVLALYYLDVNLVAIPLSQVVTWPAGIDAALLPSAMAEDFDVELVLAQDPDLIMVPHSLAETHGATLESLGLPVYYVMAGHVVPYESVLLQTEALIAAFGTEEAAEAVAEIEQSFADLEVRMAEMRERTAGVSVMVLQSAPPSHFIQSENATLGGMLEMLGFTNVFRHPGAPMVPVDFEEALDYDPDWLFAVGSSPTAAEHQAMMEADFANNPDYWNSIRAIREGYIFYMPVTFISSAGIAIVDTIHDLIDMIDARMGL